MHHVVKYGRHCSLVSCTYVLQPKWHYSVVEVAYGCSESCFLCILWCHSDLIVSIETIHERKHGTSYRRIY